jgi:hypothetical protein
MDSVSVNRILANRDNLAREALISATAQRPSTDIRLVSQSRQGGGRLTVVGPFACAEDSVIDVEVTSGTGGELVASLPVVLGVGSGALTVDAIDSAAVPDTITFALASKGTPPAPAALEFYGATLVSKLPGLGGNDLAVSVARNLIATPTQYSTLDAISAGATQSEGDAWNWGQPPASGNGIPPAALRIQFEGMPTVHRAWKVWESGRFTYRLDPAAPYDIPADTRILAVEGDYTLTLTDGAATETYPGIVTVYDFLTAVDTHSLLVDVRGVIAFDTAPGGMAVTDIPLRTDAHALPAIGGKVIVSAVDPDAPTENLTLTPAPGGGQWSVAGAVSGALPPATAGVLYTHGPASFTIAPVESGAQLGARINARYVPVMRKSGQALPSICFAPLLLGAAAVDKTVTYTWRPRPASGCHCERKPALHVSLSCLGLAPGGDGTMLDPEYKARLEALYAFRQEFVAANTTTGPDAIAVVQDLDFVDRVTGTFAGALDEMYTVPDADVATAEPLWDSYRTAMQSELASLYGVEGHLPSIAVPDASVIATDTTTAAGWAAITAQATTIQGGRIGSIYYNASNQHYYRLDRNDSGDPDTYGSSEIVLPYFRPIYTESGGQWSATGWDEIPPFSDEDWAVGGTHLLVLEPGMTGPSGAKINYRGLVFGYTDLGMAPDAEAGQGSGGGTSTGGENLNIDRINGSFAAIVDQLDRRYAAQMDHVRAVAGIVPKSDASGMNSVAGDGCWRDPGHSWWWEDESGEYLPMFNNEPYVSCVMVNSMAQTTKEFGVGVVTDCEHRLLEGDKIVITIKGTGVAATLGAITLPIIAAAPAQFAGGDEGDNTQTWTVRSALAGALAYWMRVPGSPTQHVAGEVTVSMTDGGIAWEVGDTIAVTLEGGTLRWRRDGGAWSDAPIFAANDLGDGLALNAVAGASPSFVSGDAWKFRAIATHGLSRLRTPRVGEAFAWDGDAVTIDIDLDAATPVESVLVALHTLPAGAKVTISDPDASWSVALPRRDGPMLAMLPEDTEAATLRLAISDTGAGAAIGWLFVGRGWQPTVGASDLSMTRQYGLARGEGLNPSALYRGRGTGGHWKWDIDQGGGLVGDNADDLVSLVDYVAAHGMEPVCLVPDIRRPERAALGVIDADELTLTDVWQWQAEGVREPVISVDLPFRAVLA